MTHQVFGLNGDTLGVDGSEVSVLEERDKVCFGCLLERHDGRGLEAEIRLHNTKSAKAFMRG